jgi:hypothetical protein
MVKLVRVTPAQPIALKILPQAFGAVWTRFSVT